MQREQELDEISAVSGLTAPRGDESDTPEETISGCADNDSVSCSVSSSAELMQTEKRVHRPHPSGSLLISAPCGSLHRDRGSPGPRTSHPVILHVHANNHFLYEAPAVGRSGLVEVATDQAHREVQSFPPAVETPEMELRHEEEDPEEHGDRVERIEMDEEEAEDVEEAEEDDEEVEVDVCHSPDRSSPSPVDLTHSSRDPEFHPATISCSPFASRGTPDSSIHLHALSCLHQGATGNSNPRYLTYTGASSTTTTPTPSATTTPTATTANAVQQHKRGLAFSVENILDPNKFTGGRLLQHLGHRTHRRGSSIHEGTFAGLQR